MAQDKSPGWFDLSSRPFRKLRVVRPALTMTEVSCNLLIEGFSHHPTPVISLYTSFTSRPVKATDEFHANVHCPVPRAGCFPGTLRLEDGKLAWDQAMASAAQQNLPWFHGYEDRARRKKRRACSFSPFSLVRRVEQAFRCPVPPREEHFKNRNLSFDSLTNSWHIRDEVHWRNGEIALAPILLFRRGTCPSRRAIGMPLGGIA